MIAAYAAHGKMSDAQRNLLTEVKVQMRGLVHVIDYTKFSGGIYMLIAIANGNHAV
jgi:hypothetical protein